RLPDPEIPRGAGAGVRAHPAARSAAARRGRGGLHTGGRRAGQRGVRCHGRAAADGALSRRAREGGAGRQLSGRARGAAPVYVAAALAAILVALAATPGSAAPPRRSLAGRLLVATDAMNDTRF